MLVLLAPSEGKAAPTEGPPVDLGTLAFGALTPQRERLLAALVRVASGPRKKALAALDLSARQADELERDALLLSAPAAPAAEVYTGVLYQYLDLASLEAAARARAAERLFIASGLWGVVGLEDRIPAYRLSIGARLPRIPNLATWWRPHLAKALPRDGLVVDLRSQAYAAAWRPAHGETVAVRVFTPEGKVVSHMAKATRGDVARRLSVEPSIPVTPHELAELIGGTLTATRPGSWTLDVVSG